MKRMLLLVLVLLCAPLSAQAIDILTETFESYPTGGICSGAVDTALEAAGWITTCGTGTTSSIVTGNTVGNRVHAGTKALMQSFVGLHCNPSCDDGSNSKLTHNFTASDEIWTRHWVYFEKIDTSLPALWIDGNNASSKMLYFNVGSVPSTVLEFQTVSPSALQFAVQRTFNVLCPGKTQPGPSCNYPPNLSGLTMPFNQWVCVETHQKMNTVGGDNGIAEIWQNNTPTLSVTTLRIRSSTSEKFNKVQIYRQGANNQYRHIDDLVVSNSGRVGGCPGGGPDTTPPGGTTPTASLNSGTQATINWPAATDNVAVTSYEVLRSTGATTPTAVLTTTSGLFYVDTSLSPGVQYNYRVQAKDAAGLTGPVSATTSVTTPTTDPFRSTTFIDQFNRIDNTDLGATYDAVGPCRITSFQVRSTTVNTRCYDAYVGASPPDDGWAMGTVKVFAGAQVADECVFLRASSTAITGYAGCIKRGSGNTMEIREYAAGTPTVLDGNTQQTPVPGDKYRLDAQGTALKLFLIRGTQEILVVSTSDGTYTTGRAAVSLFVATSGNLANVEMDDFAYGGFTSSADTVSFDAVSNSAAGNTTTSISWSHTTGSSSNRALAVCAQARDTVAGDTLVSSMTYGGQALTIVRNDLQTNGGSSFRTTLGYLINPPSGTNTVNITFAGAPASYGVGTATSYSGVDQASPIDAQSGGTGSSTTPTAAITTVNNNAMITDCVLDQSPGLTATGAGGSATARANRETTGTVDSTGVSTWLQPTAGAVTMSWTATTGNWATSMISLKPGVATPVVPPSLTSLVLDATGGTVVPGATTPTYVRVDTFTGLQVISSIEYVYSTSFPANRFTQAWQPGLLGVCMYPRDALHAESPGALNLHACDDLIGIVPAPDTDAIVMSSPFPATDLPFGATAATIGFQVNKPGDCRVSLTDTTYDLMTSTAQMTVSSLTASFAATGLTSPGTTTYHGQCSFVNEIGNEIVTTASLTVPVVVAASTADTTPPSTVAGTVATPLGPTSAEVRHTVATDVGGVLKYEYYLAVSTGGVCGTYVLAATVAHPTITTNLTTLAPGTDYCTTVLAYDLSLNPSAAQSNVATFTTPALQDTERPSTMVLTSVTNIGTQSGVVNWIPCTDNFGSCTSTIEISPAGCSDYAPSPNTSNVSTSHLALTLSPGTSYCVRGFHTDAAGLRSLDFSNVKTFTTATVGLSQDRTPLTFGAERPASAERPDGVARPAR